MIMRLRQWLLSGLAAISLVLCIATAVLWVGSHWAEDRLFLQLHWHFCDFASFRGEIGSEFGRFYDTEDYYKANWLIFHSQDSVQNVPPSDYVHIVEAEGRFKNRPHYHDVVGFRWHPRSDLDWEYRERGIAIPAWFVVLVTAMLPARKGPDMVRRSKRRVAGFCAVCGYDLRATPLRCPECGMVPAATGDVG